MRLVTDILRSNSYIRDENQSFQTSENLYARLKISPVYSAEDFYP